MNYKKLNELLLTARDPSLGKPIKCNTRIYRRGPALVIRHYSTDILCYFEDGTIDVSAGWSSNCTRDRLNDYAGIQLRKVTLPTMCRSRPDVDKMLCMTVNNQTVHFCSALGTSYIRINPDGRIDISTVRTLEVTYLTSTTGLRAVQNHIKKLAEQIAVRYKLLGVQEGLDWDIPGFLIKHARTPIEEAMRDDAPAVPFDRIKLPSLHTLAKYFHQAKTVQIKTPCFV